MHGRTGAARSRDARRRGRVVAIVLSLAAHAFVFGWFALRQDAAGPGAETRTVMVQLVRLHREPRQTPAAQPPTPSSGRPSPIPRETAVAPRMAPVAPPSGGGTGSQGGADLFGPVFADGRWPRPEPLVRARCDPLKDPQRRSPACRREDEVALGVSRANDPRNGRDDFANEARRKEALRRYRETIGGEDPGLACSLLHRC